MFIHYPEDNTDRMDSTDELKDSTFKTVVVGFCIPACILAIIITNTVIGKVFLLSRNGLDGDTFDGYLQSYPYSILFAGVVIIKGSIAAALFSWYGLANIDRWENWTTPALLASIISLVIGFALLSIGFFL